MSDLTDFLLARIAEDDENARRYVDLFPEGDMAPLFRRVLAECEAKRRIVEWHRPDEEGRCVDDHHYPQPCPTVRFLALPYSDHPDYREEWRA